MFTSFPSPHLDFAREGGLNELEGFLETHLLPASVGTDLPRGKDVVVKNRMDVSKVF